MAETVHLTALQSIEQFISSFNDSWLHGKWEVLRELLHDEVTFVLPDLSTTFTGKETCLDSIREYTEHAKTKSFEVTRSDIRIWGNTATVITDYSVSYEIAGELFSEVGTEIWTLIQVGMKWKIVWRGLIHNEPTD